MDGNNPLRVSVARKKPFLPATRRRRFWMHGELYGRAVTPHGHEAIDQLTPPVHHGGAWTVAVIDTGGTPSDGDLIVDSAGESLRKLRPIIASNGAERPLDLDLAALRGRWQRICVRGEANTLRHRALWHGFLRQRRLHVDSTFRQRRFLGIVGLAYVPRRKRRRSAVRIAGREFIRSRFRHHRCRRKQ